MIRKLKGLTAAPWFMVLLAMGSQQFTPSEQRRHEARQAPQQLPKARKNTVPLIKSQANLDTRGQHRVL
ncbi:MAG: hypothetical protein BroJett014_09720 [Planctomycetota bacterium]|nr:MAG: hypothetical protein BroJett014_09720 [Planctomycetota bacterium]